MTPRVYLETIVPSYLTAWPSRDVVRAAHQQITRDWWADNRRGFELYVSQLVLDECADGDPTAAAERLAVLAGTRILIPGDAEADLARELSAVVPLPPRAEADAVHVATATIKGMDYLLTWNCTHIANAVILDRFERVCRARGLRMPTVCTPGQLMGRRADADG